MKLDERAVLDEFLSASWATLHLSHKKLSILSMYIRLALQFIPLLVKYYSGKSTLLILLEAYGSCVIS